MNGVSVECPECGVSETTDLGPTLCLSIEAKVKVETIRCSKCDYEGPPEGGLR